MNEKLKRYLNMKYESMTHAKEWWMDEYYTNPDVTYSAVCYSMNSHRDTIQGAIAFAYYSDVIDKKEFHKLHSQAYDMYQSCMREINDMFIAGRETKEEE